MTWHENLEENGPQIASKTTHLTIWALLAVFLVTIVSAFVLKLEIVAQGAGLVVPKERVQVVQPEFAGTVQAIAVENGMAVEKGDLLVRLDDTATRAQLETLTLENQRLDVELLRIDVSLKHLVDPRDSTERILSAALTEFRAGIPERAGNYALEQEQLLASDIGRVTKQLEQQNSNVRIARQSELVTRSRIEKIDRQIEISKSRLDMRRRLRDLGIVSEDRYLEDFAAFRQLEAERQVQSNVLQLDQEKTRMLAAKRDLMLSQYRNALQQRKAKILATREELEQEIVVFERRLKGARIVAPMGGVVDQLGIYTVGGVVAPAQELMRIVPLNQSYEIEAYFQNSDIGFLEPGLKCNIKLDTYPAERYGFLPGRILSVSANSAQTKLGEYAFLVRVVPDAPFLEQYGQRYALRPGMAAQVDVITGERRIISYFFAPIIKAIQNGLRER